MQILLLLCK